MQELKFIEVVRRQDEASENPLSALYFFKSKKGYKFHFYIEKSDLIRVLETSSEYLLKTPKNEGEQENPEYVEQRQTEYEVGLQALSNAQSNVERGAKKVSDFPEFNSMRQLKFVEVARRQDGSGEDHLAVYYQYKHETGFQFYFYTEEFGLAHALASSRDHLLRDRNSSDVMENPYEDPRYVEDKEAAYETGLLALRTALADVGSGVKRTNDFPKFQLGIL